MDQALLQRQFPIGTVKWMYLTFRKYDEKEEMRELIAKQKQQNEELKEMMNAYQEENKATVRHLEKQLQTTLDLINGFTKQQEQQVDICLLKIMYFRVATFFFPCNK